MKAARLREESVKEAGIRKERMKKNVSSKSVSVRESVTEVASESTSKEKSMNRVLSYVKSLMLSRLLPGDSAGDRPNQPHPPVRALLLAWSEWIGKPVGLAVLAQGLPPVLTDRMNGHGEKAKFHVRSVY